MALTQLTTDLNIVQSLDTLPNDVGGLTDAQLKAKFDEPGNIIKNYLNNTLLQQLPIEFLKKDGDFIGTLMGMPITAANPGQSSIVNGLLAESLQHRVNHYYVGANQKYTTITAAYNQWVADGRPKSVIHILSGTYNESLQILGSTTTYQLSFIGENKKNVIWKTTNGYYKDAPLHYQGEGIIQGITFIADHSTNPSYAYSPLSGNVFIDNVGGAYGLHVDFPGSGKMLIKDCDIISYQNAGLGCGTRLNQHLALENVNSYSYTAVASNSAQQLSNGGLLYHTTNELAAENQTFSMKNVNVFSENSNAFTFTDYSQDLIATKHMELINCNFASNTVTTRTGLFVYNAGPYSATTGLPVTQNSFGNNIEIFNKSYSDDITYQTPILTKSDGYAKDNITDANLAVSGIHLCSVNTPLGGSTPHIILPLMANSFYGIQYAWVLSTGAKYKRTKTAGTWNSWVAITEP